MDRCCTADLHDKEVINVCDGRRLGYVIDVEFDLCDGRICALIVPGECNMLGFGKGNDIVIPWDKIERIGEDTILVKMAELVFRDGCCQDDRKKKKRGLFS